MEARYLTNIPGPAKLHTFHKIHQIITNLKLIPAAWSRCFSVKTNRLGELVASEMASVYLHRRAISALPFDCSRFGRARAGRMRYSSSMLSSPFLTMWSRTSSIYDRYDAQQLDLVAVPGAIQVTLWPLVPGGRGPGTHPQRRGDLSGARRGVNLDVLGHYQAQRKLAEKEKGKALCSAMVSVFMRTPPEGNVCATGTRSCSNHR